MSETLQILSAVHGIAPKSDQLLRLGADLERRRISEPSYHDQVDKETAEWLALQSEAGIDIQENGKLKWQDHLRPIVKVTDGFTPEIDQAPVTRWFEDNRFYRKPTIEDRLRLNYDLFEAVFPDTGEHISLLSPRAFANLCSDRYVELPAECNILQLYSELLFALEQRGVKRVTFEDYADGRLTHGGKNESLADIETLASWCPDIQFSIINPQDNATAIPWRLQQNLGIQIPKEDLSIIAREPEYNQPDLRKGEVWQQVEDASTTHSRELSIGRSAEILVKFGVSRLVLSHTVDLECVPLSYAKDKVKRLGEFAASLKETI